MTPNNKPPITQNVIVFGETGAGKSSVINMMAETSMSAVSAGAGLSTFHSTAYPITLKGRQLNMFDTTGLNEHEQGLSSPTNSMTQLYELIRGLEEGISLLVYCIRGPRITESTAKNYKLFFSNLCHKQVPIVAVVTGLENEDPMSAWWDKNKGEFQKYKMSFHGHACVTASKGKRDRYAEEYAESQIAIREVVLKNLRKEPWKVERRSWFMAVAQSIVGSVGEAFRPTVDRVLQEHGEQPDEQKSRPSGDDNRAYVQETTSPGPISGSSIQMRGRTPHISEVEKTSNHGSNREVEDRSSKAEISTKEAVTENPRATEEVPGVEVLKESELIMSKWAEGGSHPGKSARDGKRSVEGIDAEWFDLAVPGAFPRSNLL